MADWPSPYPKESFGRPSRKGAGVVVSAHLETLLGEGIRGALAEALRKEPSLGGQERRFCAFAVRELSRHMRLLDLAAKLLGQPPSQWARREDEALIRYALWRRIFTGADWTRLKPEIGLPGPIRPRTIPDPLLQELTQKPLPAYPEPPEPAAAAAQRHSFPKWLAERIASAAPAGQGEAVLAGLNEEPALWMRARPLGTRSSLQETLAAEKLPTDAPSVAPDALRMLEPGTRVFDTAPARANRLQSQDLGSQLIVRLCEPEGGFEGRSVLDYCAGAGGKTLYLADLVGPSGKVVAHDRSKRRLEDARGRVRQLSLRNVSFSAQVDFAAADVVLVDAPCSGSGSLAREPERKWHIDAKEVADFAKTQREILETVVRGLRPGASVVYATCSLLSEEDEAVVDAVCAAHPELEVQPASKWLPPEVCQGPYLRVWPQQFHSGGFFAARLMRKR